MNVRLFELDGKTIKPTEHCYVIPWLKAVMDEFPEDYMKAYAYIYYNSYFAPDNPYFNIKEDDREEKILKDLQPDFDPEHEVIVEAIENCTEIYTTPTMDSYQAIKIMLEKLNHYLKTTTITDGRDGNIGPILRVAKEFEAVRKSFKGVYQDVQEENQVRARGGAKLSYDLKRRK